MKLKDVIIELGKGESEVSLQHGCCCEVITSSDTLEGAKMLAEGGADLRYFDDECPYHTKLMKQWREEGGPDGRIGGGGQ